MGIPSNLQLGRRSCRRKIKIQQKQTKPDDTRQNSIVEILNKYGRSLKKKEMKEVKSLKKDISL